MLDDVKSYIIEEQYSILLRTEDTLNTLYEYDKHNIELNVLINELLEDSDINKFYMKIIEMYKTHTNNLCSIIGLGLSNDIMLQDRVTILRALVDINYKEDGLKQDAYDHLESYASNEEKLTYLLAALNVLEDPIIINEIYTVSDTLIEDISDILEGKEEDLKDTVKEKVLESIAITLLGPTDEVNSIIEEFKPYMDEKVNVLLSDKRNRFLTDTKSLINLIVLALLFTKNGRDETTLTYIIIKDILDIEDATLDVFVYPLIGAMESLLKNGKG